MFKQALLAVALTLCCIGLANANVIRLQLPTFNFSSPTGVADWDRALEIHNNLRASVGVDPLSWDDVLREVWT